MNKIRLKYIAGFVIGALLFGCNDSESDLLETKVYFEENSVTIKASGDDVITHDLQARLICCLYVCGHLLCLSSKVRISLISSSANR